MCVCLPACLYVYHVQSVQCLLRPEVSGLLELELEIVLSPRFRRWNLNMGPARAASALLSPEYHSSQMYSKLHTLHLSQSFWFVLVF